MQCNTSVVASSHQGPSFLYARSVWGCIAGVYYRRGVNARVNETRACALRNPKVEGFSTPGAPGAI